MKLCMPDTACVGITVNNTAYQGRIVEVTNPHHQKALLGEGAFPASLLGVRPSNGYRCGCGFASFFKICGRCGAECEKE